MIDEMKTQLEELQTIKEKLVEQTRNIEELQEIVKKKE